MDKKYYIGLDIGTNSCGFAVTDDKYNICKVKGEKLWGVRLFDEAKQAVERRGKRTNRRRLARRKLKLQWLQEIFAEEIAKVDKSFFQRLKYSSLWEEDKLLMDNSLNSKDSLFFGKVNGKEYTDKDFYKEYHTTYHLRNELLTKPAKDVRFLYLALHNIIKRRGHFLFERDYSQNVKVQDAINDFVSFIQSLDVDFLYANDLKQIDDEQESKILQCISQNKGIKDTREEIYKIFNTNNKVSKSIINILVSGKVNLKDLFYMEEKYEFLFDSEEYETKTLKELESMLAEEQLIMLDKLKSIYSTLQLKKILKNFDYICESMVDIYKTHKKHLALFKAFVKDYYPKEMYRVFKEPIAKVDKLNYAGYVNGTQIGGKKQVLNVDSKGRDNQNFYNFVNDLLKKDTEVENVDREVYEQRKAEIQELIDNKTFMPKIRTKANGVLPNQLYVKEIKKILETNAKKFTFLQEKDSTGLTNIEKIISILKFRIPYFVGPIGNSEDAESTFGWVQKQSNEELRPWNLEKIVDFDKAEDSFIQRMTNKCTYLHGKDVLPKNSLLYAKFRVLNELNNLKINGNRLTVQEKQGIFDNLFKKYKNVTLNRVKEYFVEEGMYTKDEVKDIVFSGIDKSFANNYSPYITFVDLFGEDFVNRNVDIIEKIIKYHTVISDKSRLEKRLKKEFSEVFTNEQIAKIKSLNFSEWGKLSKDFLQDMRVVNRVTGEITSIIDELWNTNQNLQEILGNSSYDIQDSLDEMNKKEKKDITYEDVQDLYCSPAVKRGVWQTICIIDEIKKAMGCMPDKIFVEVTRHDEEKGDKGRKDARKDSLLKLYKSKDFKKVVESMKVDIDKLMNQLENQDNKALRSDKFYLYYLQLGKCMYSGEELDIDELKDDNICDIDHIIPQSKIKDDSIKNKALVIKQYNTDKDDYYPISSKYPEWVAKQKPFWEHLLKLHLIDEDKYNRLVRQDDVTDEELGTFIARQLVETNQSAKAVIDILKTMVKNPRDVVYSKAKFVSDFRNKFNIYKVREVNDLHHAKDAYLNVVVGNVLFNRFTDDPRKFYMKNDDNKGVSKNVVKVFEYNIRSPKDSSIIWHGKEDAERVKDICIKNDCLVTKMSYKTLNGGFYDETLYKSTRKLANTNAKIVRKGDENNPLHDISKYGGFNKNSIAYFMLVESEDKKGKKKTIESVPISVYRKYVNDKDKEQKILQYVQEDNNLINAKVLIPYINIQSTLIIGGGMYWLAGKTNESYVLHNANQWYMTNEQLRYAKAIVKYMEIKKNKLDSTLVEIDDKVIISPARKENNVEIALTRQENVQMYDLIIEQLTRKMYKELSLSNIVKNKLNEKRDVFLSLSVKEQAELLYKVMKRMGTGAQSADLSLLGDIKSAGVITINKNVTGKDISLVQSSYTGLYHKVIKL